MTSPNSNRALLGPQENPKKKNRKTAAYLKRVERAGKSWPRRIRLMNARKVADRMAQSKLLSDLDIAKVEVGHAMGVHTRAKTAMMAARGLAAYEHDFAVSRRALTKEQKVFARIVGLLIERAKRNRSISSWIHRCSADAALEARNSCLEDVHFQDYDNQTLAAQQALLRAHSQVRKLDLVLTLLNVKNLLVKLSDIYLTLANLVLRHGPNFNQNLASGIVKNVAKILKGLKLELAKTSVVFDTIAPGQLFPAESADHDAKQQLYLDLSNHWARTAEDSSMPWKDASVYCVMFSLV